MEPVYREAVEPQRWTLVFHRSAQNWVFSLIALGHFKHVSAFAWLPELKVWLVYDVTFRRTRLVVLPDTQESKSLICDVIRGNALVSMTVRHDAFPIMRLGLFCTTAIKHLIGLRSGALRPDALFRLCVAEGGELSDDAAQSHPATGRSESCGRATAGPARADQQPASSNAG